MLREHVGRGAEEMRRLVFLLTVIALVLVLASGVALAVDRIGTNGPDTLRGTNGADNVLGGSGNDFVTGDRGSDSLVGEEGMDLVDGGPGPDRVGGGDGPDLLIDGPFEETSRDTLSSGDGNDALFVDNRPATRDIVTCGSGFDRVVADERDLVASDCEQVRRGPNAGPSLERYLERSGFFDELFGGLAPFPAG